jgi:ectoine hydroxylase-related dioxygenase (phytanoyl-CoA dioxygenase family)
MGDCPIELGGLAVLAGSHKTGAVGEHYFSLGAGGLALAVA